MPISDRDTKHVATIRTSEAATLRVVFVSTDCGYLVELQSESQRVLVPVQALPELLVVLRGALHIARMARVRGIGHDFSEGIVRQAFADAEAELAAFRERRANPEPQRGRA